MSEDTSDIGFSASLYALSITGQTYEVSATAKTPAQGFEAEVYQIAFEGEA